MLGLSSSRVMADIWVLLNWPKNCHNSSTGPRNIVSTSTYIMASMCGSSFCKMNHTSMLQIFLGFICRYLWIQQNSIFINLTFSSHTIKNFRFKSTYLILKVVWTYRYEEPLSSALAEQIHPILLMIFRKFYSVQFKVKLIPSEILPII